ncbi:hypothetical protein PCASD_18166 [Puccinia coronata f. sp. avenae]|uniref:Endonuclease/exonuclease/phosphatase domain-containing protein n=1 Tax=Puccinia coronata f. sp. avenae TaxID=200324 RepID=A0A2N5TSR1_9BASI|nr:hypothetical protein PCASD_18166 [Puccinia coronata f. sp. avenae]
MPDGLRLQTINLYVQPGTTTGIDQLGTWLETSNNQRMATIIGMDSNLHHHSWNPPGYHPVHKTANSLVSLCGKNIYRLISEKDTPTFLSRRGSKTAIDLTWANFLASRRFASTSTSSDNQGSDHQKLITHITTRPPKPTFHTVSPKAADIDQACLQKTVQAKLTQLSPHLQHLPIDEVEQELTSSIFNAWQDQGKQVRVNHAKFKKWWDKETLNPLIKIHNQCQQLLVLATPSPENAERFNFWNGRFREAVSCLKQQQWRSFLSLTDSTSVFQDFQFTKPQSGVEPLLLGGIELERE